MKKEQVANSLLERGSLFVHLDASAPRVLVPDHLRKPYLILEFGLNMAKPIRDLRLDGEGISGTLSFASSPYRVFVPWAAVYALSDNPTFPVGQCTGATWPREQVQAPERPKLRLVK